MAARQARPGDRAIGPAWLHGALGARLRRRQEPAHAEILSHYQRNTDSVNDWYRDSGGGEAVLMLLASCRHRKRGPCERNILLLCSLSSPRPQAGYIRIRPARIG